jgi:hypothetical protein
MKPPPTFCEYCTFFGPFVLVSFKPRSFEKLQEGDCGHPNYMIWMCEGCKSLVDENNLTRYTWEVGTKKLKKLIKGF